MEDKDRLEVLKTEMNILQQRIAEKEKAQKEATALEEHVQSESLKSLRPAFEASVTAVEWHCPHCDSKCSQRGHFMSWYCERSKCIYSYFEGTDFMGDGPTPVENPKRVFIYK